MRVTVKVSEGSGDLMFTEKAAGEAGRMYWMPFWRGMWHIWKLLKAGHTVEAGT